MEKSDLIVQRVDGKTAWITMTESGRDIVEKFMRTDEIIVENARKKSAI